MAFARAQDSGRFSALDEDLGGTEVDEGGDIADCRESTVNESPRVSDAKGPIIHQEVAPTVMDAPSAISKDLHAESNVESGFSPWQILNQDASTLGVDPGSLAFSAEARAAMCFFCEVEDKGVRDEEPTCLSEGRLSFSGAFCIG